MALLPGDGVEHCGHHEEPTEAKPIDPGGDGLPVVVGQEVEVGAAEDAGNDPELKAERGRVLQGQAWPWGVGRYTIPELPRACAHRLLQTRNVQQNLRPWWEGPRPAPSSMGSTGPLTAKS